MFGIGRGWSGFRVLSGSCERLGLRTVFGRVESLVGWLTSGIIEFVGGCSVLLIKVHRV